MGNYVGYRRVLGAALCLLASNGALAEVTVYDQLYPTYAEVCAVTAEKPKGGSASGAGGHAVLYLKGACRDTSVGYPRLRPCQPGEKDPNDSESGTGISVDEVFRNVNWMAIDGRSLMVSGGLSRNETLTTAARDRAVRQIVDGGMLQGIIPHPKYMERKPAGMTEQERMARLGVGLNFGLTFGRNAYCARMPVPAEMLQPMIDNLNRRNEEFVTGAKDYKWDVLSDNCAHAAHNAVAAAGLFRAYKINAPLPVQLFNLAVPANEYIDWIEYGNDSPLSDPVEMYRNTRLRDLLVNRGWLPVQPGVLSHFTPVHAKNDLYETQGNDFLVLEFPLFSPKRSILERAMRDARYFDVRANLTYFKNEYLRILRDKKSADQIREDNTDYWGDGRPPRDLRSKDFDRFVSRYYTYVTDQLANVERMLSSLTR